MNGHGHRLPCSTVETLRGLFGISGFGGCALKYTSGDDVLPRASYHAIRRRAWTKKEAEMHCAPHALFWDDDLCYTLCQHFSKIDLASLRESDPHSTGNPSHAPPLPWACIYPSPKRPGQCRFHWRDLPRQPCSPLAFPVPSYSPTPFPPVFVSPCLQVFKISVDLAILVPVTAGTAAVGTVRPCSPVTRHKPEKATERSVAVLL